MRRVTITMKRSLYQGQAERGMEKHLRILLNLKSKVAYTHQPVSADERMTGGYHDARSRTLVVDSRVNDST